MVVLEPADSERFKNSPPRRPQEDSDKVDLKILENTVIAQIPVKIGRNRTFHARDQSWSFDEVLAGN